MAEVVKLQTLDAAEKAEPVEMNTSRSIKRVLAYCKARGKLAAIYGAPGVGKTETLHRFTQGDHPCVLITVTPSCRAHVPFLMELAQALDGYSGNGAQQNRALVVQGIARKMEMGKGLLIAIDEAQNLCDDALEELWTLNDQTGCGIVLCGNPSLPERWEANGSKADRWAHFASRLWVTLRIAHPHPADVDAMCRSFGVPGGRGRKLLEAQAAKPGALRNLVHTVEWARLIADGAALTAAHIEEAIFMRGGQ
ncbi:MAG: AAA family ATPase [bacterium]